MMALEMFMELDYSPSAAVLKGIKSLYFNISTLLQVKAALLLGPF